MSLLFFTGCAPGISDYSYDVAGGYQLDRTSSHEISVVPLGGWSDKSQIIPPKVVKIAWNERYVIAEQQELEPNPNGVEEPINKYHYWILDTGLKHTYGPFDKENFEIKKKEFKISESLKLKDARSFRK
jgi:hypothetical protein